MDTTGDTTEDTTGDTKSWGQREIGAIWSLDARGEMWNYNTTYPLSAMYRTDEESYSKWQYLMGIAT